MNPDLPAELIGIILSNLNSVSALLNGRLVCRTWNAECLSLLRKSRFRKTVGPSDLKKAIQFGSHQGQFILPFRLDQNLKLNFETEKMFERRSAAEFRKMGRRVARLMEMCGPDCIRDYQLEFGHCGAKGLFAFNKFLGLISQHLETFVLVLSSRRRLGCLEAVQILRTDPVLLPKLKELSYFRGRDDDEEEDDEDRQEEEEFVEDEEPVQERVGIESVLIENSHSLERLKLRGAGMYFFCPTKLDNLTAAFRTLKTLDVGYLGFPVQFLEKIRASAHTNRFEPIFFGILETFVFCATFDERLEEQMRATQDIVQMFSKTLKSITVTLGPSHRSPTIAVPLKFPETGLPHLEHLSLIFHHVDYPCFADPRGLNLSQGACPVLYSVEIPFGCMLATPPPTPDSGNHHFVPSTTFPSVRKLALLLDSHTFDENFAATTKKCIRWEGHDCAGVCQPTCPHELQLQISPQAYVELVAQIFPSVTTLTVSNDEMTHGTFGMESVIRPILESELDWAIEEFEIRALVGLSYLRNVLGAPTFVNKMTDLKKIRFRSSRTWIIPRYFDFSYLAILAEHFPELKEIEIAARLVLIGRTEAECQEELAGYEAWNIKLI